MLISNLFRPVIKRDPKTGVWGVQSNSVRGMEEALEKCRKLNQLDQQLAEHNGVTLENYRQAKIRYEMGG